jgi:esterase/lipase superfamily enzyme
MGVHSVGVTNDKERSMFPMPDNSTIHTGKIQQVRARLSSRFAIRLSVAAWASVAVCQIGCKSEMPELPAVASASPLKAVASASPLKKPAYVKVFYATSRKKSPPPDSESKEHPRYYSNEWNPGQLTWGHCNISMPTEKKLPPGVIEGSKWYFLDLEDNPREDVWMRAPREFDGPESFAQELKEYIPSQQHRSVLVAVHGFNNTFEFAARRLAKMVHDMNYHGTPALYSWATDDTGDLRRRYQHDFNQVTQTDELDGFIRFLAVVHEAAREANATQIHLVAHSMGNQLLMRAADRLAHDHPGKKFFDAVVLAAPDIPVDGFEETVWPDLKSIADDFCLYVSEHDKPLLTSEFYNSFGPRLGLKNGEPVFVNGLQTIDASAVKNSFLSHTPHLTLAGICDLSAALMMGWNPARRVQEGTLLAISTPSGTYYRLQPRTECEWVAEQ